ncbi:MAG: agmatinase [Euryarchaeota archaeon]|nr:agmatinase [Euryarchaeota archaeon]
MIYSLPFTFGRRELDAGEAEYAVVGVPYDSSQSYRSGSREAPAAIREASREIEDYDMLEDFDLLELKIADMGDVEVSFGSSEETRRRVREAVGHILDNDAVPVLLGGEHTISAFAVEVLPEDTLFVSFDAHLDFREEYLNNPYSHACVLRRVAEHVGYDNVLAVGVRSACREELEDARRLGVEFIPVTECFDLEGVAARLAGAVEGRRVYLSIDMDFFDPAEARGVANPEPPGLGFRDFLRLLDSLRGARLQCLDVTEVVPRLDAYTPVLAARLIFKVLARYKKGK